MIVELLTVSEKKVLDPMIGERPRTHKLLMVSETDFTKREGWVDMFRRFTVIWEGQ